MCRKRSEDFVLLPLGHTDDVKGAPELGRDFIELVRRDLKVAMGLLEADGRAPRPRGGVLERSTGDVADPQGAHELQAGQPAEVVRVPLAESRVFRLLADDRVLDDRIAEMVDHRCDREDAAEPLVQTCIRHGSSPRVMVRG